MLGPNNDNNYGFGHFIMVNDHYNLFLLFSCQFFLSFCHKNSTLKFAVCLASSPIPSGCSVRTLSRIMPSESMDQEMVDALSSAQQGKDILAEMVVDLETQLDQTKSDKAAAYLDNSTLANEVRRFEGKLVEVTEERDKLLQSNAQEKSAFSTTLDELNGSWIQMQQATGCLGEGGDE